MAQIQGFPNTQSPFVNPQTGMIEQVWIRFLQQLFTASNGSATGGGGGGSGSTGGPVLSPTVGSSPFKYTAPATGSIFLSGGKITSVGFKRGLQTFAAPGWFSVGWMPVSAGDVVTITYELQPTTFRFLPS